MDLTISGLYSGSSCVFRLLRRGLGSVCMFFFGASGV